MDYYSVLGVDKNASQADIKKAYRKLAIKYHPDKSGGNETQFKKIQEAYDILGNESKRKQYDNPQSTGNWQFKDDVVNPFEDLFRNARRRPYQNPDGMMHVEISLKDAFEGGDFPLNLEHGQINLKIPAGVRDGTKFKVPGFGPQRFAELPAGDLYVTVFTRPESGWARDGDSLYVGARIDAIDAMKGTEVDITHISGKKYKVTIPPGVQPGEKVRLKGLGMTNPGNSVVGSLYVVVDIYIPAIKDEESIELLDKIKGKLNG